MMTESHPHSLLLLPGIEPAFQTRNAEPHCPLGLPPYPVVSIPSIAGGEALSIVVTTYFPGPLGLGRMWDRRPSARRAKALRDTALFFIASESGYRVIEHVGTVSRRSSEFTTIVPVASTPTIGVTTYFAG